MSGVEIVPIEGSCYYSVLGFCKQASDAEIHGAYRLREASYVFLQKWHPDRWIKDPAITHLAKKKFQQIHEAYSDWGKRSIYDAGFLDILADQDDDTEEDSLEDLQKLLMDMVDGNEQQHISLWNR